MSARLMGDVFYHRGIDKSALLVMLALADSADDFGGNCFPSAELLAKKCRCTVRHVRRVIREIEASGLIDIESTNGLRSNRYQLNIDPEMIDKPVRGQGKIVSSAPAKGGDICDMGGVTFDAGGGDICDKQDASNVTLPLKENLQRESNDCTKKGSRLSESWTLPEPWGTWALKQGLHDETIRYQADQFKDYWISVPGQRGVKLNWKATWRRWIRTSMERGSSSRPEPMTASDHIMADLNRRAQLG